MSGDVIVHSFLVQVPLSTPNSKCWFIELYDENSPLYLTGNCMWSSQLIVDCTGLRRGGEYVFTCRCRRVGNANAREVRRGGVCLGDWVDRVADG